MEMKTQGSTRTKQVIDCISGKTETISVPARRDTEFRYPQYVGPGLIDLQVNGINGIDFNSPDLSTQDLVNANQYLLSKAVTSFFPTIVTNSDENILKMLAAIHRACKEDILLDACIGGIHLEGPFISPEDGARGAHNLNYVKAPDWELFQKFQQASGGRIALVTIAPEWEGSCEFIARCRKQHIIVSIGHSLANPDQIRNAVDAGARMSTHLGNGVPLMLPRHTNIIWEQLANDMLYACLIGDGIHIPDALLKVVMKTKGNRAILVSDATLFAGMPPGEYQNNIGGTVVVDAMKRVAMKNSPGLLAGAGKSLLEGIEYLIQHKVASLSDAWKMASTNVQTMLQENNLTPVPDSTSDDRVFFNIRNHSIEAVMTIKHEQIIIHP